MRDNLVMIIFKIEVNSLNKNFNSLAVVAAKHVQYRHNSQSKQSAFQSTAK